MKKTCEYKAFTGHFIEEGVVQIAFKKVKKLHASDVDDIFDCYKKCGALKGLYVLITFAGFIPMSEEAMSQGKKLESKGNVKATAYVFRVAAMRLAFKFFTTFYKPRRKISVFKSKEDALKWLRKEKKANA